jgi:hypothetical protein
MGVLSVTVRLCLLVAAAVVFVSMTTGAGCSSSEGKATVRTAEEAKTFIDEFLSGAKTASEFKLAKGADAVAEAAFADTGPLSQLRRLVDEAPGHACDVLDITKNVAEAQAGSPFQVLLTTEQDDEIRDIADKNYGVPVSFTNRVINAVHGMANSTLVDSVVTACSVAANP